MLGWRARVALVAGACFLSGGYALREKVARLSDVQPFAFVFTVGCTGEYQEFQSVLVEWSWKDTGTEGTLTRVVNGCKTKAQRAEAARSVLHGDQRFEVFYAKGDLSHPPGPHKTPYPYRARPWALVQWLEAGLPPWSQLSKPKMVVIMDPDFMLLRPLSAHPQVKNVRQGHMLAATYDVGGGWIWDLPKILDEPLPEGMTEGVALRDYAGGAPWFVDFEDFRKVLPLWANYTDRLCLKKGEFLDEQIAFLLASAHFKIPMLPEGDTISISQPIAAREVWSKTKDDPSSWKPYLMHYCQPYEYKGWKFYKPMVTRDGWYGEAFDNTIPGVLSCDARPLHEPPVAPDAAEEPDTKARMAAWFLHLIIPRINSGMLAYRKTRCPNFEESRKGPFVRTHDAVMCGGRKTTMYYVPEGEGPQASSWSDNTVVGDEVCAWQGPKTSVAQ